MYACRLAAAGSGVGHRLLEACQAGKVAVVHPTGVPLVTPVKTFSLLPAPCQLQPALGKPTRVEARQADGRHCITRVPERLIGGQQVEQQQQVPLLQWGGT